MTLPDDLTKRLRNTGHVFARSPYHDLLDEAADRIEELEATVDRLAEGIGYDTECDGCTKLSIEHRGYCALRIAHEWQADR